MKLKFAFLFIIILVAVLFVNERTEAEVVVPTPVFYLPLTSDTSDVSGNDHDVTNNGGTIVDDPVKGHALYQSTNDQSLVVDAPLPESFTKTAWVRLDTLETSGYGFNISTNESGSYFWVSVSTFNAGPPTHATLRAGHFGGASGPTYVYDQEAFPLQTWTHVAITFDNASKTYSLYKNGQLISTSVASEAPPAATNSTIGNFGGVNGWKGRMSGVGLWSSAMTAEQIQAVYEGNVGPGIEVPIDTPEVPVELPVPVFFLPFDSNNDDVSGNNRAVTNSGTTIENSPQRGGGVVSLSDNTKKLTVDATQPSSFTKAAWVNLSTLTTPGYGMNIITTADNSFWWVSDQYAGGPTKTLRAGHFGGSGGPGYVYDSVEFPTNTWAHVVLTFDNSTKRYSLYKNGILVSSHIAADAPSISSPVTIGNFADINGWIGQMDNVGLWDVAFSQDQVKSNYNGRSGLENPVSPSSPRNLSGNSGLGYVELSWTSPSSSGGSAITDYLIEYKRSASSTWNIFPHTSSTSTSITIESLSDDTSYDFRVSAINSIGTSEPSSTIVSIPGLSKYYYILSTGQSLSTGYDATPPISTYQPYNNLMFSTGVEATSTPLIPLVESGQGENGNVETPSSGIVNTLRALSTDYKPFIIGLHGHNGTEYSGLAKGTSYYNKGMTQLANAKAYVEGLDAQLVPVGVTVIHGENDYFAGNSSSYQSSLEQWQADYESDINVLMGTNNILPMFIDQMNTGLTGELAVAQLEAHKANPEKIFLVGPKYQYEYHSDHLHLKNIDSLLLGEMYGKVMRKVLFEEVSWNPLMPTSVSRSGNIITISYHNPYGTLAIDTTTVAMRPDYGFEFVQTDGNAVSIENVQLINNDSQVRITLSEEPNGSDQKVRYAWTCSGGYGGYPNCGGSLDSTRVGGNIRNTDSSVSPAPNSSGLPLYDWSVTFEEPVIVGTQFTNTSSASVTQTQATLATSIDLVGEDNPTEIGFVYGTTDLYSATSTISGSIETKTYSIELSDLTCGTTYHWNSYVISDLGTRYGEDMQFQTEACSVQESSSRKRSNIIKVPVPVEEAVISNDTIQTQADDVFRFNNDLSEGSTGEDVWYLQKLLNRLGYTVALNGSGSIGNETTYFGILTRKAVSLFQAANSISPTAGFFGPVTRNIANTLSEGTGTSVQTKDLSYYIENLRLGMSGDDVLIFQQELINLNKGPASRALTEVGATGYYGSLTQSAVAELQASLE